MQTANGAALTTHVGEVVMKALTNFFVRYVQKLMPDPFIFVTV